MFFEDWTLLGEVVLTTVLIYALLVIVLRVTGKRTTSKMNSFDWVVTVAIGSMLSTVILIDEVPFVEGALGITTLVVLQFVVAWVAARLPGFQKMVKASPQLVYYDGEFREEAMLKERLTLDDIMASVRAEGHASLDPVLAVVMETNADLSVLLKSDHEKEDALQDVSGWTRWE